MFGISSVRTSRVIEMANIPSTRVSIREVFIHILDMDIRSPQYRLLIFPPPKEKETLDL